jgi:hypothetical protein
VAFNLLLFAVLDAAYLRGPLLGAIAGTTCSRSCCW